MTATRPATQAAPTAPRRPSLRTKALLITVLPVLTLGLLITLILTLQRRAELDTISRAVSHTAASLLASTLDVQDLNLVATQLRAAVSAPDVAFVDVQPAGNTPRFFTSDTPDTDWHLRAQLDTHQRAHPGQTHLTLPDTRADAYQSALNALQPGTPPSVRDHLQARLGTLQAAGGHPTTYELTTLDVYETPFGTRALRLPGDPAPPGQLLFRLGIGVTLNDMNLALQRQLHLVLLACAATALIAAYAAWRAMRRPLRVILAITDAAQHASLGHLGDPITVTPGGRPDELTDLITAIERLRVSLHLALTRLRPGNRP
ncbi:hypothetical protein [Deinococcus aquaticus]|uniref:hypothetical protein n=1 Tax=Deinococcus aquaticus TaxID=328692 RepID=UPI003F469943